MVYTIGYYSLVFSIFYLFIFFIRNLYVNHINNMSISNSLNIRFYYFSFFFIIIAFLVLLYQFIFTNYFSLNVFTHSEVNQSFIYKIAALWANHEGSFFLWTFFLFGLSFFFLTSLSNYVYNNNYLLLFIITFIFFIFLVFNSNPFLKYNLFFIEGRELNPILQDPTLSIHPPLIFLGYTGLVIPFTFVSVYILYNHINYYYFYTITLFTWVILTVGITLGSWWAYYELGWGGFWFWDPVENTSIIPWLLLTALFHNFIINKKYRFVSSNVIALSLLGFFFALVATFFIRSGLLNSVHSFAADNSRGVFLFIISFLFLVLIIFLFYISGINSYNYYFFSLSRDNTIYIFSFFFIFFAFIIFIGTFSPIFFILLFKHSITIGPPFFNSILIPLFIPFLFVFLFSFFSRWLQNTTFFKFFYFFFPFIVSLLFVFLYNDISFDIYLFYIITTIFFFSFIIYLSYHSFFIPRFFVSHLGFIFFIFACSSYSFFNFEIINVFFPADQIKFFNYIFTIRDINFIQYNNYSSYFASISVQHLYDDTFFFTLFPEKKFYFLKGIFTTKAAIISNLFVDIYTIIGDGNFFNGFYLRFVIFPSIPFLWLAATLIFYSALYILSFSFLFFVFWF